MNFSASGYHKRTICFHAKFYCTVYCTECIKYKTKLQCYCIILFVCKVQKSINFVTIKHNGDMSKYGNVSLGYVCITVVEDIKLKFVSSHL